MMRLAGRIALIGTLASALVGTVAAEPAMAFPDGCSHYNVGVNGGEAYCSSGSGWYQVIVYCRQPIFYDYEVYGPVRQVGSGLTSYADCSYWARRGVAIALLG
jgi:hypothetical protein